MFSNFQYLLHYFLSTKFFLLPLALLLVLAALFVYKMILLPKFIIRHYKVQGIKTCFFRGLNPIKAWDDLALKHGNCLYPWADFVNKNPDVPAFIDNMGPFIHLQLVDPKYIKEFFQKELECYKKGWLFDVMKLFLGESIITAPVDIWKARRRLYSQTFHFKHLKDNVSTMEDQAIRFCNDIHPSKLETVNIFKLSKNYTGLVAGQSFFGRDMLKVMVEGESIVNYLSEYCGVGFALFRSPLVFAFGARIVPLGLLSSHREFIRRRKALRLACKRLIAEKEREMNEKPEDAAASSNLLEVFIKAKHSASEAQVTDESIVDEFINFFFAGVDTTSYLISHCCYYIAKYPYITKRLREEITAHWSLGQPLTINTINELDYLYAFIKEVFRNSPVANGPADREATKDHQLLDIKVKKGTLLSCGFYSMSSNPKYYKDPSVFDPDRFLRKDPEEKFNSDPFTFIPFSAGRRNCLGQHLSLLETRVLLIHLLMRYDFELPENYQYQLHIGEGGFLVPIQPLNLKLKPRY